jgi:hypothetical protein
MGSTALHTCMPCRYGDNGQLDMRLEASLPLWEGLPRACPRAAQPSYSGLLPSGPAQQKARATKNKMARAHEKQAPTHGCTGHH